MFEIRSGMDEKHRCWAAVTLFTEAEKLTEHYCLRRVAPESLDDFVAVARRPSSKRRSSEVEDYRVTRIVVCTLLFLLPASMASAQEWARKMFEATTHDFGAVARGAKTEFHFKFSNLYNEDVHVAGVRSSCGCTSPQVTKDSLKTYDDSSIVAVFNTHAFQGQKNATVTVTFDKPYYAEVQLQVSGYIRTDIVVTPGSVDWGQVDAGAGATKRLTLSYAGRSDWKVTGHRSSNPLVAAEIREQSRRNGQITYEIDVAMKSDAPVGYLREQIVLLTNDARSPEVPIEVQGRIVSDLTISPASLFLGAVEPGQKVTKQLVIQGRKPFKIVSITADAEGFEFKPADMAKPVQLVPVTYTAGNLAGKQTFTIKIETDLGQKQEVQAHVQVIGPLANK